MAHACNPSIPEVEPKRSEVQVYPWLHSKSEASLGSLFKKSLQGEGGILPRSQDTHQNLNQLGHRHKSDAILHGSFVSIGTSLGELLTHSFKINEFMQLAQGPHSRPSIS